MNKKLFCAAALLGTAAIVLSSACDRTYPAKNTEDIRAFLTECGISTAGDGSRRTVTIPAEFGAVYEKYNELQKQQGFDLTGYRSREAEVYTFPAVSVNGVHTDNTEAHVMVCDGIVIGGDIASPAIGGEMKPIIPAG